MKTNKVPMKEKLKACIPVMIGILAISTNAFAAGAGGDLTKGTTSLVSTLSTWAIGLVPTVGGFAVAYQVIKKNLADGDPGEVSVANKRIKQIVISTVIGTVASGMIAWITSFYK